MKPRKLTTIPPMSRLLPLMPPRKLTVLRLGSLRLASPAPCSCAIRGAQSDKAKKAIRARRTEPVRVIESFPPKGIVRLAHDIGLLAGAGTRTSLFEEKPNVQYKRSRCRNSMRGGAGDWAGDWAGHARPLLERRLHFEVGLSGERWSSLNAVRTANDS